MLLKLIRAYLAFVRRFALANFLLYTLPLEAPTPHPTEKVVVVKKEHKGLSSVYGTRKDGFLGKMMASGRVLRPGMLVAAHPWLPFGTLLRVINPRSGASIEVRVMDRGPFIPGRILDLSHAAAERLGFSGVNRVIFQEIKHIWTDKPPVVIKSITQADTQPPHKEFQ